MTTTPQEALQQAKDALQMALDRIGDERPEHTRQDVEDWDTFSSALAETGGRL